MGANSREELLAFIAEQRDRLEKLEAVRETANRVSRIWHGEIHPGSIAQAHLELRNALLKAEKE